VSAARETFAARRAVLQERAAAERAALARQLAPIAALDSGLERVRIVKSELAAAAMGAGLGLSALLMMLPVGRTPLVRGGIAMLHLAGSVRRLCSRR
jgi:hypothetical protein